MLKDFFSKLSLNNKLILMMLFLSFILLFVLHFLYWQSEKVLLNELSDQTTELTKAIQVGVEEVTASGTTDEKKLAKYMEDIKSKAKGINEISIISNTDEVIKSTNPTKIGPVSPKKKELIIKAELGEPVSEEGKIYNVIVPVIAGGAHYGYIHLKINADDVSAILKQNFFKRIFATLVVFAIGIGMAVFLSRRYTEPIHNVVDAARKVAAGDLNQDLILNRKDEIGELTKSFNFMVKRLREIKQTEERLREAEHLSAVGQLSRTIAHEIRNPLNFISLSIDHIRKRFRPQDERTKSFDDLMASMKEEIHRLNKLVNDFLDYGKPLKLNLKNTSVGELLKDVTDIIKPKAESERVSLTEQYGFTPEIMVDPDLLKTCILNVIMNAFQAMPEGGTLSIKTDRDDGRFVLEIHDTGEGIGRDNLGKVFEPFFTTKDKGLGLGLATTKRIIEEHGGKITLESTKGAGSNVIISLPLN